MKNPGYTIDQHEQLAIEIQTMRDRIRIIGSDLILHYPIKTKAIGRLKKIELLFEEVKNEMENLAYKEHMGKTDTELGKLYSRPLREDHVNSPKASRLLE